MSGIDAVIPIVRTWAASQPRVSAVYLFGSRVTGNHRADSDLDVAVTLLNRKEMPGDFRDWAELASQLRGSLAPLLPFPLDLTHYENTDETPVVHQGLLAGSRLVYSLDG